jgi:hypothetical protein
MSLSKSAEKRMLTADEFETVGRTHYPEIRELSRKDLSDLVRRLRDHRDKARDTARQQRREMRGKSEPRGATPASDDTGTARKGEIFAAAVKRVNREIARHDQRRSALRPAGQVAPRAATQAGERQARSPQARAHRIARHALDAEQGAHRRNRPARNRPRLPVRQEIPGPPRQPVMIQLTVTNSQFVIAGPDPAIHSIEISVG